MADKKLDTQLVNAGRSKKYTLGAVNSVIQRASSLGYLRVWKPKSTRRAIAPMASCSMDGAER